MEARGNRWRITGELENSAVEAAVEVVEESGSPGGRRGGLAVRVSLMKHS